MTSQAALATRRPVLCSGAVNRRGMRTLVASATTSALAVLLDRRARHGSVGAEDAAIARPRLEPGTASAAVVKELASVGRHGLCGLVPALRAGQGRLKLHRIACAFR